MTDDDTSTGDREMGIELGPLSEELSTLDYPIGKDEFLDEYGDYELELPDSEATVSSLLEPLDIDEFDSEESVRQSIFNMVGGEAVGRRGYSDRGTTSKATGEQEDESF